LGCKAIPEIKEVVVGKFETLTLAESTISEITYSWFWIYSKR
jgi:hypothetical protein